MLVENGLTRRDFLKGVVVMLGSAALAGCDIGKRPETSTKPTPRPVSSTPELVIPQEDIALKEAVEQQFKIELYNPAQAVLPYVEPHTSGIPIQWDGARLDTLRESLPKLPEYFYQPSEQNRRLRLELTTGRFSEASRDEIGLSFVQFDPSKPREAFSTLTREFVYRVMPTTTLTDGDKSSPWFDEVEQVIGEEFSDTSERLARTAYNWLLWHKSEAEDEKMVFYHSIYRDAEPQDSRLMLAAKTPRSFIAGMGEHYIKGKDYFTKMYGELFPTNTVNQLYDFVKEDIFKGKEY